MDTPYMGTGKDLDRGRRMTRQVDLKPDEDGVLNMSRVPENSNV